MKISVDYSMVSHSDYQLNDVRALLRTEGLDKSYIEKWVRDLALDSMWEMVQS